MPKIKNILNFEMDSNELMGCFKTPLLAKSMTGGINAIVLVGGNDTPLKFYTQH